MADESRLRLASLDQFRGYTVAGMFLVNFLSDFAVTPAVLRHHHTYCSYADTIMPQFFFAVGFAFRLTFLRRAASEGAAAARLRAAQRIGGLALLALVVHAAPAVARSWTELSELGFWGALYAPLKRHWFQTLMHIAVTSLWVLPVIGARPTVRVAWMIGSAIAHIGLSGWFNFQWVNTGPVGIDGGPLGFLTWTIPLLTGSLAFDAVDFAARRAQVGKMLGWSAALMLLGYGLSCGTRLYDVSESERSTKSEQTLAERPVVPRLDSLAGRAWTEYLAEPPFVPPPGPAERKWNYWMMSQRAGTASYLTFAAGLSLALFVVAHLACDRLGWQIGFLRTLGSNALAAYIIHDLTGPAVAAFVPADSPAWYVALGTSAFLGLTYLFVRYLERNGIYLRM